MPLLLIVVISFALQDVHAKLTSSKLRLQVINRDGRELSLKLGQALESELAQSSGAGSPQVIIEIPQDFENFRKATRDHNKPLVPIVFKVDPSLDSVYIKLIETALILSLQSIALDQAGQNMDQEQQNDFFSSFSQAVKLETPEAKKKTNPRETMLQWIQQELPVRRPLPTPLQQTVPAWTLFAMFFIALPLSNSFLFERKNGLLQRLRTYPIPVWALIGGKLLPYFMVNLIQAGSILVFGFWIAPILGLQALELGRHPWTLLPMFCCMALTATSYGVMISSLCRTYEQASAVGAFSVVIMAMLGGLMVPVFVMPEMMQTLAKISPLYWGLQGIHEVFLLEGQWQQAWPYMKAMLLWSTAFIFVGWFKFRWD